MATVGDLAVRVGADIADFKSGMDNAASYAKKFTESASKNLLKVAKDAAKITAAVTGAAGSILYLSNKTGEAARELGVLANVANSTESEFQRMSIAAGKYNIQQDKLADILKDVNDRVGDFLSTGGGPMADFFENIAPRVGVTANQFRNLSGPQALQLYVSSLEQANLSQEEMTFYLEAMASDLTNLLPLLSNNGKLLNEQADRAERLGLVLSDIDSAKLQEMNAELNLSKKVIEATTMKIGAELAPFVTEIANRFLIAAEESGGFGDQVEFAITKAMHFAGQFVNMLHGIRVVFKGLELIAYGFGGAVTSVFEMAGTGVAALVDEITAKINVAIETINQLPGVSIGLIDTISDSDFMVGLHAMGDSARQKVVDLRAELQSLALQELPGDKVVEFLETVKTKSNEAAIEVAAIKNAFTAEDPEAMSQEDIYAQKENALRDHLKNMYGIQQTGSKGITGLIDKQWGFAASTTVGAMASIAETMSTGNKKAFEISKKFAMADAVISTLQGIAAGVKLGWPMAIPAVAWAAATGYAQISKIKSQTYSGGGGSDVASAAATSTASSSTATSSSSSESSSGTLTVAPIDPSAIFSGSAMQAFGQQIYDYSKDGGKVVFSA